MSPHSKAWLILTLTPGLGPTRIARLIEHFGHAAKVLSATSEMLAEIEGVSIKARRKSAGPSMRFVSAIL